MKKILSFLPLFALVVMSMTSCLKDKGFEDQKYGINDPDDSKPGVGFYNGKKTKDTYGVNAGATPQTINLVINYTGGTPPTSDVTVQVSVNNALVNDYNTANGTSTVVAPTGTISVPTTVVIPAGQRFANLVITIPDATVFDPSLEYGIGITLTSVDQNVQVAGNLKNLFVAINIKNKYDGVYSMNSFHNRPGYQTLIVGEEMDMITSGPSSVIYYWSDQGSVGHPISSSPGTLAWYGPTVAPQITFDPTTDLVVDVNNTDPAGPPISVYTGAGSGVGRYDAATKKIYAYFRYNANDARAFLDTLTYLRPRD